MAIVPGCDYDVFISYAHIDNEDGWVVKFAEKLKTALERRLGDTRQLEIFWDKSKVKGGSTRLPELLAAARASACFLAIGSPSYIVRQWPLDELKEFANSCPDHNRVFLIEVMPLDEEDSYPEPLHDIVSLAFWKNVEQTKLPLAFHSDLDDISTKVHHLADIISKKLRTLRLLPEPPPAPRLPQAPVNQATRAAAAASKKTILLAQPTEDVDEEMDQVRSFLQQYGDEIAILPSSGYPQGGDAFRAAFSTDLSQANYVVQLLGRRAGRTPPDLPEGYTLFQAEAARTAGVKLLQWRRPDLDLESIPDPYRKLLKSGTVIASGLEAFKQQILKEIHNEEERQQREEEKKRREQDRKQQGWIESSTVFINADTSDKLIAKKVELECIKNTLPTFHSQEGPLSESLRRDLAENLIDCDLLLFIYGDTTVEWVRAQCRFFSKVRKDRTTEPKLFAICSGPGPKPDIGINFPNAYFIECPGWDLEPVRRRIQEANR